MAYPTSRLLFLLNSEQYWQQLNRTQEDSRAREEEGRRYCWNMQICCCRYASQVSKFGSGNDENGNLHIDTNHNQHLQRLNLYSFSWRPSFSLAHSIGTWKMDNLRQVEGGEDKEISSPLYLHCTAPLLRPRNRKLTLLHKFVAMDGKRPRDFLVVSLLTV